MFSLHNALAAAMLAACAAVELGGAAQERVSVEADVFSGRPNPTWSMSPDDARVAVSMLDRLPRTTPGKVEERLGYRGTIIRVKRSTWRLFRGRAFESGTGTWKVDDGRKLELFALKTGKSLMDSATYKMVLEEAGFGRADAEAQHER